MISRRGTVLVALAGTVLILASCGEHPSASRSTTTSTPTTTTTVPPIPKPMVAVDMSVTPKGWVPVDYGDAQISVPSSWVITFDTCQQAGGTVYLGPQNNPRYGCPPLQSYDAVFLLPVPQPAPHTGPTHPMLVNGVEVFRVVGAPTSWLVPGLAVELDLRGPLRTRILSTLTHSPRSVALGPGPAPSIPSSWHRVSFGDLSIAVPSAWPELHSSSWGSCVPSNLSLFSPIAVELNTGTSASAIVCPYESELEVLAATNGLVIDPGHYGPLENAPTYGHCLHINGLTACPTITDLYGVLVLAVHLPNRTQPVAVEIGLAGDGMVARTILDSIRQSGTNATAPTTSTTMPAQTHGAATCAAAQLAATATRESGAYSHMGIVVAFRTTATECSLDGYPTAWFVDAASRRLGDVSAHQSGGTASVVLLPRGGLASTTVWTVDPRMVAGGSVGASCQPAAATGIDLTLPGQSAVVFAPIVVSVCTTDPAVPWTTPIVSGTQERTS